MAIANVPINNLFLSATTPTSTINLATNFDDTFTTGLVARFRLDNAYGGNKVISLVLFDQAAPLSVKNFQNYVDSGKYANSIIHRSVSNFIVQGGGFTVNNLAVGTIPTNAPVQNEFSSQRSNLRGTIAFAKLGSDPNSATSQWFFNLANNSSNLDNQNGGFTVFGKVLSTTDLSTIDAIAAVPIYNGSRINQAFTDLPLSLDNPDITQITSDNNYIRFSNIDITQERELTYTIVSDSNPTLFNPAISDQKLTLANTSNKGGTSNIVVRATNLFGEFVDSAFSVTVSSPKLNTPIRRFQNSGVPGTYLFAGESEALGIRANFKDFKEEGLAFQVAVEKTDSLMQPIFRFQNTSIPGTYLFAGESEAANIRINFKNFKEEGTAFFVYGVGSGQGTTFNRFQNRSRPGTYLFAGPVETNSILANNKNFVLEGAAFEVG
jgi:peptidyl-prolyl cis-trans isomerase A (cyclophilin A)